MSGKLVFYHGTVCSSKTMTLLAMANNYEACGRTVCAIKPSIDTRSEMIVTRAGLPPRKADIVLKPNESLSAYNDIIRVANIVFVDECQFLTVAHVEELRNITIKNNIDVLCFGLRTDFNTHLFEASKRMFELADEFIEVKSICGVCGEQAGFNIKVGTKRTDGVFLPSWNEFEGRCFKHYHG